MRYLTVFFSVLFFIIACRQSNKIEPGSIDYVELVQVGHPYLGNRDDSIILDNKLIDEFLIDFTDKKEDVTKFYSCYVIKIHLKDGQLISYRTNGKVFEKFMDSNTKAIYFKLNKNINLVTKYWKIEEKDFCKTIPTVRHIISAHAKP